MDKLFDLAGRTAVVTGATAGLGQAMAVALARAGANIVVAGRNADGGAETLRRIAEGSEARAIFVRGDLRRAADIDGLIEGACDAFGGVDILINNAGINEPTPSMDMTRAQWRAILDTNLDSAVFMAQVAARQMRRQGGGVIVNTASMSGMMVNYQVAQAAYYGAKAALIMLTKSWAVEWAGDGIRVNALAPGYMRTAQCHKSFTDPACADMVGNWFRLTPAGRPGEPDELGGSVVFLASDASGYMTGHTLVVDGGSTVY